METTNETPSRPAQSRRATVANLARIPELDERLAISVHEFCYLTGIDRASAYRAIERGTLRAFRGPLSRVVIRTDDARRFIDGLPVYLGRRKTAASQ